MKLAIVALIAIVLLGGGATGAYFFLNKPAEAAGGPMDEAARAAHEAKTAEAAAAMPAVYVPLDVLVLPVIDERGITQNISLVISLEVTDQEAASAVQNLIPRLKDAYIQDMYGVLSRKSIMENGVLQIAPIKDRLNRVSVRVLGQDKVKDVLLQVVQQKRT